MRSRRVKLRILSYDFRTGEADCELTEQETAVQEPLFTPETPPPPAEEEPKTLSEKQLYRLWHNGGVPEKYATSRPYSEMAALVGDIKARLERGEVIPRPIIPIPPEFLPPGPFELKGKRPVGRPRKITV